MDSSGWDHVRPSEEKNKDAWPLMRPLLADPALAPDKAARERSLSAFEMFLRIRNSSPLFRLRDDAAVREHLRFLNTGPAQIPRSEEHTSELQSLMRISYAVFCLKKKTNNKTIRIKHTNNKA